MRLDNTRSQSNYPQSTASTTNFWFLRSRFRKTFSPFAAAAAAAIRGMERFNFFYLLTEKYQAIKLLLQLHSKLLANSKEVLDSVPQ